MGAHTCPWRLLIAVVLVVVRFNCLSSAPEIRMCYYRSAHRHRTNIAKFDIQDIDFTLCTHYIYAYASINNRGRIVSVEVSEDGSGGLYQKFNRAKSTAGSSKSLLSVGGEGQIMALTNVSLNPTLLNAFVTSAVSILTRNSFDGLDLDYVYPYDPITRGAHIDILKALKQEFTKQGQKQFILTATGEGNPVYGIQYYNIPEIVTTVDYIILKTNKIVLNRMDYAHFYSPLYSTSFKSFSPLLSLNSSLLIWQSKGVPYTKMVVGLSQLGTFLELEDRFQHEPGSNITKKVQSGPFYNINNALAYPEICLIINSSTRFFDEFHKNPYLVKEANWIGYEDEESLRFKLEFISSLGVAGVMIPALDEDDFTGTMCGRGRYPLLSFVKRYGQPQETSTSTLISISAAENTHADSDTASTTVETDNAEILETDLSFLKYVFIGIAILLCPLLGYLIFLLIKKWQDDKDDGGTEGDVILEVEVVDHDSNVEKGAGKGEEKEEDQEEEKEEDQEEEKEETTTIVL